MKFGHLGFEHAHLDLQFLSTLDGALMLGAVIMSLLTQSDYFGLQQPILLLERGLFLPQHTRLRPARLLGDHHACGATIAGCLRRVPQKIALAAFFRRRVHRIFTNLRGHWDEFAVAIRAPWCQGSGHGSPSLTSSSTLSSTLVRRRIIIGSGANFLKCMFLSGERFCRLQAAKTTANISGASGLAECLLVNTLIFAPKLDPGAWSLKDKASVCGALSLRLSAV